MGIEPKTPRWLVQDPTTSPSGDLIPTIRGSGVRPGADAEGSGRSSPVSGPREEEDQQKDCRLFLRLLRRLLPSTDTDIKHQGKTADIFIPKKV